jgi:hypothetical protein
MPPGAGQKHLPFAGAPSFQNIGTLHGQYAFLDAKQISDALKIWNSCGTQATYADFIFGYSYIA